MSTWQRRRAGPLIALAVVLLALLGSCVRRSDERPAVAISGPMQVSHSGRYVAFYTCLTDHTGSLVGNQMVVADLPQHDIANRSESRDVFDRPLAWHPKKDILVTARCVWSRRLNKLFLMGPDQPEPMDLAPDGLDLLDARWSPDGNEIVCEALPRGERGAAPAIYRLSGDAAGQSRIPGTTGARIAAVRPCEGGGYLIFLRYMHRRDDGYDQSISLVRTATDRSEEVVPVDWHVVSLDDVSADGEKLAMRRSAAEGAPAEPLVYEWRGTEAPTTIAGLRDTILRSTWSPNGDRLLCVGRSHLWVWTVRTNLVRRLPFEDWQPADGLTPVAWLPDGGALVVGVGSRLLRVDSEDGSAVLVVDLSAP